MPGVLTVANGMRSRLIVPVASYLMSINVMDVELANTSVLRIPMEATEVLAGEASISSASIFSQRIVLFMVKKYEGRRFFKPSVLRNLVVALVGASVLVSLIFNVGWGTMSSMGYKAIALLCPLGALESMLGTWVIIPRTLVILLVTIAIVIFFGKVFCSWACPIPPLSQFFKTKKAKAEEKKVQQEAAEHSLTKYHGNKERCGACKQTKVSFDSRHFVLLGALGSTAIFGFPVFCIVCPIGLLFATAIAVVRLIGFNEPSFGLIIFPVILLVEFLILRKWCHKICPMGALMSLVASLNRTFKPKVEQNKCLRFAENADCTVCSSVCPEHIDPHSNLGLRTTAECTRCNRCAEACPNGAIRFIWQKKVPSIITNKERTNNV
jgi:ferredoxin-type protein NapH